MIKREFITERYTNTVLCRAHRSLLAKVRGGSAPLEIERGRYIGIPAAQGYVSYAVMEGKMRFIFQ